MKAKILNLLSKIKQILQRIFTKFKNATIVSYAKCKEGEEQMKNIILYWSIIPSILYLLISYKLCLPRFLHAIIDVFMLFFSILVFYFIQKAVKIHPEYDSELMEELRKAEYYSTLNEEQLKKEKRKESLNKKKNFFKGLFNVGAGKKIDFYKIVRAFLILIFLVALRRIIF